MHLHAVELREIENARGAMEKRLDGMNEFRESLNDQRKTTVSRELFDSTLEALGSRVASMERLLPIVALLSAVVGAAISGLIVKAVG